jgi:hypothetical protein
MVPIMVQQHPTDCRCEELNNATDFEGIWNLFLEIRPARHPADFFAPFLHMARLSPDSLYLICAELSSDSPKAMDREAAWVFFSLYDIAAIIIRNCRPWRLPSRLDKKSLVFLPRITDEDSQDIMSEVRLALLKAAKSKHGLGMPKHAGIADSIRRWTKAIVRRNALRIADRIRQQAPIASTSQPEPTIEDILDSRFMRDNFWDFLVRLEGQGNASFYWPYFLEKHQKQRLIPIPDIMAGLDIAASNRRTLETRAKSILLKFQSKKFGERWPKTY